MTALANKSFKYLIVLFICTLCGHLSADWEWAHTIGGSDMERCWDIACDSQSNVIIAGEFMGVMLIGNQTYTAAGLTDSFVAKFNPQGQLLWAKTFGSVEEDCVLGVDTDASGNCYLAGYFVDTLVCQGQSRNSHGMWDGYVLKLNPAGELQWLNSYGGTMNDIGHGLAVNSTGQVFVAGWFADSITFEDGASITSAGGSDVYLASWNSEGTFRWAKRAGTEGVEYGYKVACDNSGAAYVTGVAGAGTPFGSYILPSSGMYVAKYAPTGDELWLAPSDGAMVMSISVQPDNDAARKGMVCGRVVGNGSIGSFPFQSLDEGDDCYWAQFDAGSGQWDYAGYFGGNASDRGRDCDYEAYPAFVGTFEEQALFYGQSFVSHGESDLIAGFGGVNNPQLITTGGANSEVPYGIKILPNNNIAVSGWHYGVSNFGAITIDSGEITNQNMFVACYNPFSQVEDHTQTPVALHASPNPFSCKLQISGLKSGEPIRIYNLKGQLVKQDYCSPDGTYTWHGLDKNGSSCSSGVYYIRSSHTQGRVLKMK